LESTQELWEHVTELCKDVQRLAYQLHPSKLEELGLVTALRDFCTEIARQSGIQIRFRDYDVPESLPDETALCLYRVAQESLWNVVKHSGAREADVQLIGDEEGLRLRVTDSGSGFEAGAARAKGLGLLSMRERLQLVGGSIEIESSPSKGTTIGATIPLAAGVPVGGMPTRDRH
jgi:signal transduction histidine kinase